MAKEEAANTDVLVIATKYNPIWESVNLSIVRDAIHKQWQQYQSFSLAGNAVARLMESRIVVAFSKTTSLGDLVNNWNSELLREAVEHPERLAEEDEFIQDSTMEGKEPGISAKEFYGGS
jgi:hypothetical protein